MICVYTIITRKIRNFSDLDLCRIKQLKSFFCVIFLTFFKVCIKKAKLLLAKDPHRHQKVVFENVSFTSKINFYPIIQIYSFNARFRSSDLKHVMTSKLIESKLKKADV